MNPVLGVLNRIGQRSLVQVVRPSERVAGGTPPSEKREATLALARELFHAVEQFVISTPDLDTRRFLDRMRGTSARLTPEADCATLKLFTEWTRNALGTFAPLQRRCVSEREDEMWRLLNTLRSTSNVGAGADQRLIQGLRESHQRMREYARLEDIRETRLYLEEEVRRAQKLVDLKAREDRDRIASLQRQVTRLEAALAAVRGQADFDVLTGVYHRGVFDQRLRDLVAGDAPCVVALIDVDNFKTINDTLGHAVGDKILTMVGENIHRVARSSDVPARFGGDEFAFAAVGFTTEQVAQRLSGAVARRHVRMDVTDPLDPNEGQHVVQVLLSTSVGITASRKSDSGESLLGRADQALLAAKKGGKGSIRIAL